MSVLKSVIRPALLPPLLLLLLLSLWALPAPGQEPWTLERCIEYATEHSPEILHRQIRYDMSRENLQEASGKRVPTIGIGAQETIHAGNALLMYGVDQSLAMSLTQLAATMEMPLLTGGALPANKAAEESAMKAAGEDIALSKMNMAIRVSAAYLQVLCSRSSEEIASRQVLHCEDQVKKVTKLVDDGMRTPADLSEARAALRDAQYRHTAAKGNTVLAKVELSNVMGLADESGFDVVDLPEGEGEGSLIPAPSFEGLENHPAILAAKYNLNSAEFKVKAAKGAYRPQLSLFANYNHYFAAPLGAQAIQIGSLSDGWGAVGLKLTVPILNVTTPRQVAKARLALSDAQVTLDQSRMEMSRRIREAYYQALTAGEKYASAIKAEEAAKEAFDYQTKMFDAGRVTSYDLEESRLRWVSASEECNRSKYESLLRERILGYYTQESTSVEEQQ